MEVANPTLLVSAAQSANAERFLATSPCLSLLLPGGCLHTANYTTNFFGKARG